MVVARGLEEEKLRSYCLIDTEFIYLEVMLVMAVQQCQCP